MNAARARRRWEAWRRWEAKLVKLSEATKATPGTMQAYNEMAWYFNTRYAYRQTGKRWARFNRHTHKRARR